MANGAFTTFVGMAPLIWAPFETGRLFLKLFSLIILLGVVHGFIALPLLLATWGPAPVGHTHDDDHAEEGSGSPLELVESVDNALALGDGAAAQEGDFAAAEAQATDL